MMKGNVWLSLLVFSLIAFVFVSCREEVEQITPDPPPSAPTTIAAVDPTPSPVNEEAPVADSALYRYEKFNEMPYRILLPKNFDPAKSYPMLIFLHGIAERGSDNEKQLTWGATLFQADSIRDRYPAIVIFPQCKAGHYWFDKWGMETLKGLIDSRKQKYNVDNGSVYIGGLSMGAYGTYALVSRHPDLFTRAVAISGDGDVTKASSMKKTKWRIFAGKKDHVVPSEKSVKMAAALKKSGATVSLTLYPNADHTESWINAFSEPDFCSWIFGNEERHDAIPVDDAGKGKSG